MTAAHPMPSGPANRVRLQDLTTLTPSEIARLPIDQLALLQAELRQQMEHLHTCKSRLDAGLHHRLGEQAQAARVAAGKDTGTVRLIDGPVTVVADLPKRVEWDQSHLRAIVQRIRDTGDDPDQYVQTSLKVSERAYSAWPQPLRTVFEPARTVHTGKPAYALSLADGGDA